MAPILWLMCSLRITRGVFKPWLRSAAPEIKKFDALPSFSRMISGKPSGVIKGVPLPTQTIISVGFYLFNI